MKRLTLAALAIALGTASFAATAKDSGFSMNFPGNGANRDLTSLSPAAGGDHSVLIGRVLRFHRRDGGAPLVFFRGRYCALA